MMSEFCMAELLKICEEQQISLAEYVIRAECVAGELNREQVMSKMAQMLAVMSAAARGGLDKPMISNSGLSGGAAHQYHSYVRQGKSLLSPVVAGAVEMALSCSEVNAAMGRIVACPTAGSCGIVPAAVLSVGRQYQKKQDELVQALFTATGIGMVIAEQATLAGADGGCQAECGSAAAMAAAGVVDLMGGSNRQAANAAALTLKNMLGLVCDPVGGLVEIPCVKRNAIGAANALVGADMALAGVESAIPFDEVVAAMYAIGKQLPAELRETGRGGLAVTPTGLALAEKLFGKGGCRNC